MKRSIILFLGVIVAVITTLAQSKIKSSDIIKQINAGQAVEYNNVEIEGNLDLTDLENRRGEYTSGNRSNTDTERYESTVEVALKFTHCTFTGDVLAYYHIECNNETYIAHFEKDVVFKDCVFSNASEFKYSEFHGMSTFTGCTFTKEANFKYAEFSSGPQFNNVKFDSGADFKYTELARGTSFEKATFHGLANFKYTKFKSPLNLENIEFKGNEDFKYTKIDGHDFTSYLLNK